jgi:hypothetical protein
MGARTPVRHLRYPDDGESHGKERLFAQPAVTISTQPALCYAYPANGAKGATAGNHVT